MLDAAGMFREFKKINTTSWVVAIFIWVNIGQ